MDNLNISEQELLDEIQALQNIAQDAQITILKVEGALQFAHHLLRQVRAQKHEVMSNDPEKS